MGQMLIRNIDDDLKQRLRERAAVNGRSMNAETREILRTALVRPFPTVSKEEIIRRFAELRARSAGRPQTPSEDLVRESRDVDAR